MQSELRSPPQNIFGRLRPFLLDQIIDFTRTQGPEALAQILCKPRAFENALRSRPIGPKNAPRIALRQEGIAALEIGNAALHFRVGKITARKRRLRRPWRLESRKERGDFVEHRFGELAERRDLAAEDREQRRLCLGRLELQYIFARRFLGLACSIIVKRADTRIGPAHHVAGDRPLEYLISRAGGLPTPGLGISGFSGAPRLFFSGVPVRVEFLL